MPSSGRAPSVPHLGYRGGGHCSERVPFVANGVFNRSVACSFAYVGVYPTEGVTRTTRGWVGGTVGPHAHGNVARHVVDDLDAEETGQHKP